uniref:Uncharacterized protein n=1 Tax=Lepeophtheirus salmonis TaxID=72036 RepID=A0A0K2TF41_LEPSM
MNDSSIKGNEIHQVKQKEARSLEHTMPLKRLSEGLKIGYPSGKISTNLINSYDHIPRYDEGFLNFRASSDR